MAELKPIIEQSMTQYAGAVLQSRALVDVRDCLKPSARQIFFCMDKYKYTAAKPFQKTMAAIGDAMKHFYIHGDSSCEGIIMRAGQPFAMRYPLVEVDGNGGTLLSSGNWAAPRYTETRLSKLAAYLFADIDKDTIDDWRDNYADNEQYPAVLPTKGFYNLVNGTSGIGIGMACSVPQYNLRELNNALIHLIDNPDCDFNEIYCAPDFATGAILYNESDVKESMKNGTGFACKLRSVVEFDSKERCFVVTEIPYGVYTNTICGQLEEIVNGEDNPGIERFNDLTGSTPLIKIYLAKKANPDRVLKYLYKNTFLQYHYGINFTMLDNGRFPRVFGWKEMLQSHIDHERIVYKRAFEFDLNKIKSRIHIIDGLLICMARIEEVVQTIRNSASTAAASAALQANFLLDEAQTKAVLDMKLSRLAHLEVKKLENERAELVGKADAIEKILNDEELFKEEIKKGWREVASKFGDARRTKIINISKDDEEPTESVCVDPRNTTEVDNDTETTEDTATGQTTHIYNTEEANDNMIEPAIGDIVVYDGVKTVVEESDGCCNDCFLSSRMCGRLLCTANLRKDGNPVRLRKALDNDTDDNRTAGRGEWELSEYSYDSIEPAVGDIVTVYGVRCTVVEGSGSCHKCAARTNGCALMDCTASDRQDNKYVYLEKLEDGVVAERSDDGDSEWSIPTQDGGVVEPKLGTTGYIHGIKAVVANVAELSGNNPCDHCAAARGNGCWKVVCAGSDRGDHTSIYLRKAED